MPLTTPTRLLIVDGHAYAYRAFHAIRSLNSPTGAPTNAIYGFIKMLTKMQGQLNPSHQVVVWDGGLAPERLAQHPEYKSQRPPMPTDLEAQIEGADGGGILGYLEAAGIASFCQPGVEADDWIAAIARQFSSEVSVVIASSDKDFMQLVSGRVGILNPNDKSEKVWGPDDVRVRTGIDPEQVVDWLALIGDSVDNIPGVPGVGPKTAADLLKQFGSVQNLVERVAEVKSDRLRASLQSALEVLRRNLDLIRLRQDQPNCQLEDLVPRPAQVERLRELFTQWGFRGMLAQVEDAESKNRAQSGARPEQGVLL
jgi:DNA polymerase-1